ncbi:MAG: sodium/proline symporter [Gammaproteobacteria bacterium]
MIIGSFLFFLLLVTGVGLASVLRSRRTVDDYYLASRAVPPALVGLSAVATNNSGYMFIGVIGFTYTNGLSAGWLMVGWIIGDLIGSLLVLRELRVVTGHTRQVSFAGVISRWGGDHFPVVRTVVALGTVVFLGAYAAAQFSAGGKALQSMFGWHVHTGALMVALVVAAYCLAGGIRASIWTDVVQSAVMLLSMGLLLVESVRALGGPADACAALAAIPGFLAWFPPALLVPGGVGMALFVVGWLFAGLSVLGQPHIMIRFMALDSPAHLARARAWYYVFFTVFYLLATGVGLLARVHLPALATLDPELALPELASLLLHPVFVGLVLAGIFAATMSTADSLVLSCSSALTHDLAPPACRSLVWSKAATLLVVTFAFAIAITGPASVFTLVILAWSTLGSAFGPLMIVYALRGRPSETLALLMICTGPLVALAWRGLGWHAQYYEGMPGMLAGLLVYAVARWRVAGRASTGAARAVNPAAESVITADTARRR